MNNTTTRYADSAEFSSYSLNDSPIALATKAAFAAAGYANPHRAVYLDAIREVRRYRVASAAMLKMVAEREVAQCVKVARDVGLTA